MSIDLKDIAKAWITSLNPKEKEKELANLRYKICGGCEFKKEIFDKKQWSSFCGKCGCPLNKKIYSNNYNNCPAGKWSEVDSLFITMLTQDLKHKDRNSLI